ncbi:phosphatidylethanolamine-binding protein [Protomyces lactucae-debilis]|uniref:Phosphatidylethanolamine-binding protein n=1 Tax=Protomyces lactucae-debilis TaxID=2754530 RepID=A0A1Y2FDV5_PROLT|nr:phosphatidylethanolamine-binding protein [Protomyces lactucae-debilis]ORY82101.1 phosphatidylethanolamine-binding protein [Protomyces lactucae-debilis]
MAKLSYTFPLLKFTTDVAFLGNNIPQARAAYPPALSFFGSPKDLFTLAIVDPDAPERNNNIISQVQHFLAFNIPGNTLAGNLSTLGDRPAGSFGYLGPSPPAGCGTHRYVIALFKQPAQIDPAVAGFGTARYPLFFNIKSYAAANKLQLVGANYWRTTAAPAPFCTFFTDASETVIAPEFAVGFGLGTDPSVYSKQPN